MNAQVAMVFPAIVLFSMSLMLTAFSLWMAGKLAPWFLQESFDPPTMRSYFFEPAADLDLTKARVVIVLIAMAIMLTFLLVMATAVKFGGMSLL
jgi:hypothetical protein